MKRALILVAPLLLSLARPAGAQELQPKSTHPVPTMPAPVTVGNSSIAGEVVPGTRASRSTSSFRYARAGVDPGSAEYAADTLDPGVVERNLTFRYVRLKPARRVPCIVKLPNGTSQSGNARVAQIYLEGMQGSDQAYLLGRRGSSVDGGNVADKAPRALGFLKARVYFASRLQTAEQDPAAGVCAGRVVFQQLDIVRLLDGAWFVPAWRATLARLQ